MKRRPLCIIALEQNPALELDSETQIPTLTDNYNFIENFQTAILLSLLEKGQLAKWQFDLCVEELARQCTSASNKK